jgi:glycosyltransferase involved in cell wall biosynthesis
LRVAVGTAFPQDPTAPHGGVEAVSVNLVRSLARLGDLEVHVVTAERSGTAPSESQWQGARIHRLPWAGGSVLRNAIGSGRRQISEFIRQLKPDVIHAHDTYGLMVKGLPIPRVFTIHGFIHADTLVAGQRFAWLRSKIWRHFETAGWADQPHVISISPYVRERLAGIATGIIHDIDNPIAEECFHIQRDEHHETIFSAGLLCRRKNTLGLLEAFKRLIAGGIDARLRLAGKASEQDYERRIREFIQSHKLETRVDLLGGISARRVREELARASIFVLVSFEEGSPMGVEEAMAAGVPVVTSNRCGMPYMVRDGESGYLVDPNDPDDIAWRLGRLLQDDDVRTRMGAKGRAIALDRFHPDVVARRTHEVYRRALPDNYRHSG